MTAFHVWFSCHSELPTTDLVKPPLPIPAPPAFTNTAAASHKAVEEEGQAESAGLDPHRADVNQVAESHNSSTQAQSDEAAQQALSSDDEELTDEVRIRLCMLEEEEELHMLQPANESDRMCHPWAMTMPSSNVLP